MIIQGDARHIPLRDGCVQTVVTSPPYWGLRDYGTGRWEGGDAACDHLSAKIKSRYDYSLATSPIQDGTRTGTDAPRYRDTCQCGAQRIDSQIGLEQTPEEYVTTMVEVFRELWRVLRDDGTVWLNLGDSYASDKSGGRNDTEKMYGPKSQHLAANGRKISTVSGLKSKDICGIPWRVAFALQADGWYLRSDVIWAKPNPMPESVTDRPTRSHEYLFLLAKAERYFYDADAIRETAVEGSDLGLLRGRNAGLEDGVAWHAPSILERQLNGVDSRTAGSGYRNKRDVWFVQSEPTPEAHFATFPQKLIEPCILAGTSEKGNCLVCGDPWTRVVESNSWGYERGEKASDWRANVAQPPQHSHVGTERVTRGWEPACDCEVPAAAALVLDPFFGSGTVGEVCERLGRRWVGLELNPKYNTIAVRRTAQRGFRFDSQRSLF